MADNPAHYHAIDKATTAWKQYLAAVSPLDEKTEAHRARLDAEEKKHDVHTTGEPGTSKERSEHAATSD